MYKRIKSSFTILSTNNALDNRPNIILKEKQLLKVFASPLLRRGGNPHGKKLYPQKSTPTCWDRHSASQPIQVIPGEEDFGHSF